MSSHHPKTKFPDNFFRVSWQFSDRTSLWGKTLLVVLPMLLLLTSFMGRPANISPFITTYLDVLDVNSQWAIPYLHNNQGYTLYFAAAFILLLTISLFLLYCISIGSTMENGVRSFDWPDLRFSWSWRAATVLCFLVMLISNIYLFDFYQDALHEGKATFLTSGSFRFCYTAALLSRIICVIAALSSFLKIVLADFARKTLRFRRKYLSYFYPSLLSISIVAFVFTQMDQFDSLFIDLIHDPANFFFFSIFLFPVSLIIVWFIPSYLSFTDVQYSERNKAWRIMSAIVGSDQRRRLKTYRWLYSHKRLFNTLPVTDEDRKAPDYFMADRQQGIPYPPPIFHTVATFLGLLFIITLTSVSIDIFDRTMPTDVLNSSLVTAGVFLCVAAYWLWCIRILKNARAPKNLAVRKLPQREFRRKSLFTDWWYNLLDRQPPEGIEPGSRAATKKTFYYVANRKPFLIGLWLTILTIALLLALLGLVALGIDWRFTYPVYLFFLILSPFVFVWLAIFQDFHPYYTFDINSKVGKDYSGDTTLTGEPPAIERQMDRFDAIITQFMLVLVIAVALLCIAVFLIGLLTKDWLSSASLQSINPLNLYLILVNGTIALIVLSDRFINLRNYNEQYSFLRKQVDEQRAWNVERAAKKIRGESQGASYQLKPFNEIETPYLFWGFVLVLFWLATTYIGNSYHEVTYQKVTQEDTAGQMDLAEYTAQFLENRPNSEEPIVFVASDGGGLKACYWTLRVLHHLDSLGLAQSGKPFYNQRVFLTSGASGGSIGLSMYTLLKSHLGNDLPEIRKRIEQIGSTNFLSGDFAGLVTRFPLNYVPENLIKEGPRKYQDRAEAMAEAYLNIVFSDSLEQGYPLLSQRPYWHLWQEANYELPLFVANSARGEDGVRGVVHPLRSNPLLTAGAMDLGRTGNLAISFPGASFLSNRFPLMSPPGRIIGKGHFVDAGSADNSGLATIYDFLRYMKTNSKVNTSRFTGDSLALSAAMKAAKVYDDFLNREIVVVSIRNAMSRFVRDEFVNELDSINRFYYQPDLTASTSAAVNSGIAGVPIAWDDYLRSPAPVELGLLDTFLTVNLPFRLRPTQVYRSLGGEFRDTTLDKRIQEINRRIHVPLGADSTYIVAPPLGRLLAKPSRDFMGRMLWHEDNVERFRWLTRD
ncbi:MAG: hypothetical protein ACJAZ9_000796 [Neolewinella sp.]|jgi:hypothetical protein